MKCQACGGTGFMEVRIVDGPSDGQHPQYRRSEARACIMGCKPPVTARGGVAGNAKLAGREMRLPAGKRQEATRDGYGGDDAGESTPWQDWYLG